MQLSFTTFRLGRFLSSSGQGCPDGHLAITENRPGAPGPPGPQPDLGPFMGQIEQQAGEKGPSPDPFSYMQAQVGPVGPRGSPGEIPSHFSPLLIVFLQVSEARPAPRVSWDLRATPETRALPALRDCKASLACPA